MLHFSVAFAFYLATAVRAVPVLDHVEPGVDLAAQIFRSDVAAQENGLDDLAELAKGGIGRVLHGGAREAAQDRFRVRRAMPQSGGVFDHLVVLALDERPIDHPAEDRRQVVEQATQFRVWQGKLLPRDRLQPRASSKPSRWQKANATSLWPWLST